MRPGTSPYFAAARAIAEQIADSAVPVPSGVTWHGDELAGEDEGALTVIRAPVGPYLYTGNAGIGWFLAHVAAATGDRRTADLAADALRVSLQAAKPGSGSLSLFSGATGIALAAVDVSRCLGRPALGEAGHVLARSVASAVRAPSATTSDWDLLGGLAGTAIGLLAIHQRRPDRLLLQACRAACTRLIDARLAGARGTAWPDPARPEAEPLCGLGHGASGAAWALAELSWLHDGGEVAAVVDEALRYERGWFSPDRCAWADLRRPAGATREESPAWTTAWCHGALGIGAVRLRMYESTGDLAALAEASASIQAARALVAQGSADLRGSRLSDVTLCHGLGGAVELMLLAYEVTGIADHLRAARRAGDLCLAICRRNGGRWTVGLRGGTDVPGLFLGLAGIGVAMLRLHDPSLAASPMLPGRMPLAEQLPPSLALEPE